MTPASAAGDARSPQESVLAGLRVVVCRTTDQAVGLLASISELGGTGIALPLLEFAEPTDSGAALDQALAGVDSFDWLVLTSANAVQAVAGRRPQLPESLRVAVVGPATSRAAAEAGWVASFEPSAATAEALASELPLDSSSAGRILAPLAELAADTIERGLQARGAVVERVDAYRMATPEHSAEAIEAALGADVVLLTSPSIANRFADLAVGAVDPRPNRRLPKAVAIGPSTKAAAVAAGFDVLATADPHTEVGLLDALVRSIGS